MTLFSPTGAAMYRGPQDTAIFPIPTPARPPLYIDAALAFATHADTRPGVARDEARHRRDAMPATLTATAGAAPEPPRPTDDPATAPPPSDHCLEPALTARPGRDSLLGARIAGARAILQDEAGDDDDVLLVAANDVHQKAVANPGNADAQAASLLLWRAEADAWAAANGAPSSLDEETRLQAYLDMWSMALDPPEPPVFHTRRDVARTYVLERARTGQSIAIATQPAPGPVPLDRLIDRFLETPEVRTRYYRQFADYVDTHLDHFSKLGAIGDALAAGIPRLRLEERPVRMWHIASLTAYPAGAHLLPSGWVLTALGRSLGESYIAEMPDGEFLHIDAAGRMAKLPPDMVDRVGRLNATALLQSLGLRSPQPAGHGESSGKEYTVSYRPCDPILLRGHIVAQRRKAVLAAIEQWKADNYLPSRTESVLRVLIPFYGLHHNLKWDPGYRLQAGDVAWDAAALAITVAGIALTAGGGSAGVVAAQASMRTVASQGVKAMIKVGMQSIMRQFHVRVLMLGGARELADFVLPVFSAARLLKSAARVTPLAAQALKTATQNAGIALRAADARLLMNGIYEVLARTAPARRNFTANTIRHTLEAASRRPVPMRIYRSESGGLRRGTPQSAIGPDASIDDILVAIIRQTACGGSETGPVMCLTVNRVVPAQSARDRPDPCIYTIDTSTAPGQFRNIEDILLNEGPRLVQAGKIHGAMLEHAVMRTLERQEERIFYIGTRIPDAMVVGREHMAPDETRDTATGG